MQWKVALVDADNLAYGAAFHIRETHHTALLKDGTELGFGKSRKTDIIKALKNSGDHDNIIALVEDYHYKPIEYGYHAIKMMVNRIQKITNADNTEFYLTSMDKSNYRFDLATIVPYKSDRAERPKYIEEMRQFLIDNYNAQVIYNKEADDVLGIEHYKYYSPDESLSTSICCSKDKDLNNIPGWRLNLNNEEVSFINHGQAINHFYSQILSGDKCDSIPGLKTWMKKRTCGPVGIKKVLNGLEDEASLYYAVKQHYMNHALTNEDKEKFRERLTEIGKLLWIQREDGIIWDPPNEHT